MEDVTPDNLLLIGFSEIKGEDATVYVRGNDVIGFAEITGLPYSKSDNSDFFIEIVKEINKAK